ncbi:hypothetical protein OG627_00090 [Streptomyces sp. NBC_01429]|nr:hypothetical protein [Streptomyces sp. NBC_01429]
MLEFVEPGRTQPAVAFTGIRLGLADPAAQGFLADAEALRNVRDGTARGADLADRPHTQLIGVFPWCRH